jgi:hypothetical protein
MLCLFSPGADINDYPPPADSLRFVDIQGKAAKRLDPLLTGKQRQYSQTVSWAARLNCRYIYQSWLQFTGPQYS